MNLTGAEIFIAEKLQTELSDRLYYHGLHHTMDVAEAAARIAWAEGITDEESLALLRTAALFHDAGFIKTYRGHESESCRMAQKYLPRFSYDARQITLICGMIQATEIPQKPQNILQEIVCDADLDYLGRDDFERIAGTLFRELKAYGMVTDERAWNATQIRFLENHHYWTSYSRTVRQPIKDQHRQQLAVTVHKN